MDPFFVRGINSWNGNLDFHPIQKETLDKTKLIPQDFSDWNDAYSRDDYGAIMRNCKLFWLTFCKEVNNKVCGDFSVSGEGSNLIVSGSKKEIEKTVNKIRKFFLKAFVEKRAIAFLFIKRCMDYYIREKADVVDLKDWLDIEVFKIFRSDFYQYVEPYIGNLACSLHANFTKAIISQKVEDKKDKGFSTEQVHCFEISWNNENYHVYPIEKIKIVARDSTSDNSYAMYLKGDFCDLKLVTKEGVILEVHSFLMYSQGGEVLQKMLTSGMNESTLKVVEFKEFSLNTVKAFVDFIYLGEKGLSFDSLKGRNLDLSELFEMAHTYQVMQLVDHCTNLISCFWDKDHLETIKFMADRYENAHLKKLYEHYLNLDIHSIFQNSLETEERHLTPSWPGVLNLEF